MYLRRNTLLFIFSLIGTVALSQQEATHWVFGGLGGLDFSCSPPRLEPSPLQVLEGTATISTSTGQLLLSTDGDVIYDRKGRVLPNGRGLGAKCDGWFNVSSSQAALIVPHPGNSNLYYVFTTDCAEDGFHDGLSYSIVDISLNDGYGDVTVKKQQLLYPAAEKIAAVFHPNGRDVWVVAHETQSNKFLAYAVTDAAGLITTPVVSRTGQLHRGGRGYLKFSPDGKRLAAGSFISSYRDGIDTELFTFDGLTGKIQSDFILTGDISYAISFSPNSKLLYTSVAWALGATYAGIIQYNLEAGTPEEIIDQRYFVPNSNITGALQLGPDGQLYYPYDDGSGFFWLYYFGVFTNPNGIGAASGHIHEYIKFPCYMHGSWGLPNFIESYFQTAAPGTPGCPSMGASLAEHVDFSVQADCSGLEVVFENTSPYQEYELPAQPDAWYVWWELDFGDGTEHLFTYEPMGTVTHTYDKPGTYYPTLAYRQYDCNADVEKKEIAVGGSQAIIDVDQDCESLGVSFAARLVPDDPDAVLHWNFGDARGNSTEATPTYQYVQPGDYTVTLSAETDCGTLTQTIDTHVHNLLDLGASVAELCEGDTLLLRVPEDLPGTVEWSFGSNQRQVSVTKAGQYSVRLLQDDCVTGDTITVSTFDCSACAYFVPNIITPNGDDKNDTFEFSIECPFLSYHMSVYDRWGARMYSTQSPVWDGRVKNDIPPAGVYYYMIEFSHMGPGHQVITEKVKGWLHIIY
jgi:gliding motility-associated-like protein